MNTYPLRTAEQLSLLLQAFRKDAGLTQREVALRLGVTQQTYSALERDAGHVGVARLLKLLGILGVELALSQPAATAGAPASADTAAEPAPGTTGDPPAW